MHPLGKVSIQWSPDFAYAIGLLATDGSLSKDGRHINFTSKDRELVESFKRCLGLGVKIGRKSSGSITGKKYYQVQFGDVLFYRWLLSLGLTPRKSKTIGALKIPRRHFFDFLRGCFDGDGSAYSYWDPRWHSSFMFYISFCSASPPFLEWLQAEINKRPVMSGGHITKARRVYMLRYAKGDSFVLFRKMYYRDRLPFLKRKYLKLRKIFAINERHDARVVKLVNT